MATIVKGKNKDKPYTVRYRHEGKQRERSFRTSKEANDFKAKFEHDSREQIFVDPKAHSDKFRDAAEKWVSRLNGSANTKRIYRSMLAGHINPVMGDWSLLKVSTSREEVTSFLRDTLPAKGLGVSTVKTSYIIIRAVVNDAVRSGKLNRTRLSGISIPSEGQRAEFYFPTYDQMTALAAGLDEYGPAVWLMMGCGLRIGEALAVKRNAFHGGVLRVSEQLTADGKPGPLKARKEGDFRDVPVPSFVLRALKGEIGADRTGYVFPSIDRRTLSGRFNRVRDAAGIASSFTPHSLRHIFASNLLSRGVPITDVSRWLGHKDINTTFSIYGHLVPQSISSTARYLDDEFAVWKETSGLRGATAERKPEGEAA